MKCENARHVQNNVKITSNCWICYQFNCKFLPIVRNLDINFSYLISKCLSVFLVEFEQVFYHFFVWKSLIQFFVVVVYETFLQEQWSQPKKQRAVVVLEIHRKVTRRSSFCNAGGCKTQFYLKRLRRTILKKSAS